MPSTLAKSNLLCFLVLILGIGFIPAGYTQILTDSKYRTIRTFRRQPNQPLRIEDIKVKGVSIVANQKFFAHDDWLDGLTITVRNESSKTILFASIDLQFPTPGESSGKLPLTTISIGNGELLTRATVTSTQSLKLQPTETAQLRVSTNEFHQILKLLQANDHSSSVVVVDCKMGRVIFDDDTMWYSGTFLHRDLLNSRNWVADP